MNAEPDQPSEKPLEELEKLVPFALRAGVVVVGREVLARRRKRLAFILITKDISENSQRKITEAFECPIVQALTSADIERFFRFRNTKVLGFTRSSISQNLFRALRSVQSAEDAEKTDEELSEDGGGNG